MYFQFTDKNKENYIAGDRLYEITANGHSAGFLTEANRNKVKRLGIPELNDGFTEIFWYDREEITLLKTDEDGVYVDYEGQGEVPLSFAADVPSEGNYRIKLTLKASEKAGLMVFAGRRRLADQSLRVAGEYIFLDFVTNICPIIPRGYDKVMEDLTCNVAVLGKGIHLQEIEIEPWDGPTLYIAGDSTVTDQPAAYPYLPGQSYCGWGQMIGALLGRQMAVSNHSHSGLTTESFRSEGHYQILLDRIRKGDICLFQFGHNDQKLMELTADGGYRKRLTEYIGEIKSKGATPVIVSPLARNSFKKVGDKLEYNDLLKPYAAECKRLAAQLEVPFIDLHAMSMEEILKLGRDKARRLFFPSDYTHSNDYGAMLFASYVCAGLANAGLVREYPCELLSVPDEEEELVIPKEYGHVKNEEEIDLFKDLERENENLTRAEAMDFIIKTCKFFPTNVYNDYFSDVVGHEIYAGIVETAYQNGMIPEEMTKDGAFHPLKEITIREFVISLMNGYSARRPLSCEHPDLIQEAANMKLIALDVEKDVPLTRRQAADICKKIYV